MSNKPNSQKPGKPDQQPFVTKQQLIGDWVKGLGIILFLVVAIVCCLDLSNWARFAWLDVPLFGYLTAIFTGVAMQFVGSAIPHMKFTQADLK